MDRLKKMFLVVLLITCVSYINADAQCNDQGMYCGIGYVPVKNARGTTRYINVVNRLGCPTQEASREQINYLIKKEMQSDEQMVRSPEYAIAKNDRVTAAGKAAVTVTNSQGKQRTVSIVIDPVAGSLGNYYWALYTKVWEALERDEQFASPIKYN